MTVWNRGDRTTAAHGGDARRQYNTAEQATAEQRGGQENIMVERYGAR
jgi:hypothetical protein